jgi:predicted RNA-binding Zn ribbon-like protein
VSSAESTAPLLGEPMPIELMNTLWADRGGPHDALGTVEDLDGWLAAVTIGSEPADPDLLAQFRELRGALRVLAAEATHDSRQHALAAAPDHAAAVATLNRASARTPSWAELDWAAAEPELRSVSSGTVAASMLSHLAELGVRLFAAPDRPELRACQGPGCVLYFARNHPRREWCSAGCGNRARVARHYARHRT